MQVHVSGCHCPIPSGSNRSESPFPKTVEKTYMKTYTPPKFNSAPLKNDAWKTMFLLERQIFRGELLNFQGVAFHFEALEFQLG